jgi:hypothetical protein
LAWLEMRVVHGTPGSSTYQQRAVFHPRGLAGHAYWWTVAPFHGLVFGGMVRNIKAAAEHAGPPSGPSAPNALRDRASSADDRGTDGFEVREPRGVLAEAVRRR